MSKRKATEQGVAQKSTVGDRLVILRTAVNNCTVIRSEVVARLDDIIKELKCKREEETDSDDDDDELLLQPRVKVPKITHAPPAAAAAPTPTPVAAAPAAPAAAPAAAAASAPPPEQKSSAFKDDAAARKAACEAARILEGLPLKEQYSIGDRVVIKVRDKKYSPAVVTGLNRTRFKCETLIHGTPHDDTKKWVACPSLARRPTAHELATLGDWDRIAAVHARRAATLAEFHSAMVTAAK